MITYLKAIQTNGTDGEVNGYVIPIWHVDSGVKVDQVYLTTIDPWKMKGPHLHHQRHGAFTVLSGSVAIVTRNGAEYTTHQCHQESPVTVHVPPGTPCALYNIGSTEALVLNLPTPPWRDNSDEFTVEDWDYEVIV